MKRGLGFIATILVLLFCSTLLSGAEKIHKVSKEQASFKPAPIKPLKIPVCDTSVLLGLSPFQVTSHFKNFRYAPIEKGGFEVIDKQHRFQFNRSIVQGRNIILTGDKPIFMVTTVTGMGVYNHAADKCFPLFGSPKGKQLDKKPDLGTLKIGVLQDNGKIRWFNQIPECRAIFYPGYTEYKIKENGWKCSMTITPAKDFCGFICKVGFDKPQHLVWTFGKIHLPPPGGQPLPENKVKISDGTAVLTSGDMPKLKVNMATVPAGKITVQKENGIPYAAYSADAPAKEYYILNTWGADSYNKKLAQEMMSRLDTPNSSAWKAAADRLKKLWFDCYIASALQPGANLKTLVSNPQKHFSKAIKTWDKRTEEFQVKTPDPYLNAIINFQRATSEYNRKGPGLLLGAGHWFMYSHISVGWYGRMWGGDIESIKDYMRFFAAMQADNGYINWISPSLAAYHAENNTPYWVDHVWWVYKWTGGKQFLKDMWPSVKKAVKYELSTNDPDGDGLLQSGYAYWNCDSGGQGPSAAAPTATGWAMCDRAAKIAGILGEKQDQQKYAKLAEKIRNAALSKLWSNKIGVLGAIGRDGIWRSHPQIWTQYIPIINGMLPLDKGRRAMRWLEAHYGFTPSDNIHLLMSCDAWPLRWSVHWVPVGDSLLAAEAGFMCGDADLWWPYVKSVADSFFRAGTPQIGFSISNSGSQGGESDLIDAIDPHTQMVIRGMFGIIPDIPEKTFYITPSFPSAWKEASIKTPAISYNYTRSGKSCTITVITPEPSVKVLTPFPGSSEKIRTKSEQTSVIRFQLPETEHLTADQNSAPQIIVDKTPRKKLPKLSDDELGKTVMLDLSELYNTTLHKMTTEVQFVSDFGRPTTIRKWWHTPSASTGPGSETITGEDGVEFLIKGRNAAAEGTGGNLIAVSSWGRIDGGYSLPGSVTIPVNRKIKSFRVLLQSYVSPLKNYIPNGEIIMHYTDKTTTSVQLIPPYNLDIYYQPFAREGASVTLGAKKKHSGGWDPCKTKYNKPNALELPVKCNPSKTLENIEIRGTCSEGVIGITAITLLPAE